MALHPCLHMKYLINGDVFLYPQAVLSSLTRWDWGKQHR